MLTSLPWPSHLGKPLTSAIAPKIQKHLSVTVACAMDFLEYTLARKPIQGSNFKFHRWVKVPTKIARGVSSVGKACCSWLLCIAILKGIRQQHKRFLLFVGLRATQKQKEQI